MTARGPITARPITARPVSDDLIFARKTGEKLTCLYPLDADYAELSGPGFEPMTMSYRNQRGSVTLNEADVAHSYAAYPAGFSTGDTVVIDASAGVKVIEWVLDALPAVTGYSVSLSVVNAAWNSTFMAATISYDGTHWHLTAGSLTESELAAPPGRIGLYFNAGNIGLLLDNVDQGNIDTYTLGDIAIGLSTDVDADLEDGQQDAIVTHTLVTYQPEITGTGYPVGTTDKCGNPI